jgi:hypothetical protein
VMFSRAFCYAPRMLDVRLHRSIDDAKRRRGRRRSR